MRLMYPAGIVRAFAYNLAAIVTPAAFVSSDHMRCGLLQASKRFSPVV
jgi:hypothetical protein